VLFSDDFDISGLRFTLSGSRLGNQVSFILNEDESLNGISPGIGPSRTRVIDAVIVENRIDEPILIVGNTMEGDGGPGQVNPPTGQDPDTTAEWSGTVQVTVHPMQFRSVFLDDSIEINEADEVMFVPTFRDARIYAGPRTNDEIPQDGTARFNAFVWETSDGSTVLVGPVGGPSGLDSSVVTVRDSTRGHSIIVRTESGVDGRSDGRVLSLSTGSATSPPEIMDEIFLTSVSLVDVDTIGLDQSGTRTFGADRFVYDDSEDPTEILCTAVINPDTVEIRDAIDEMVTWTLDESLFLTGEVELEVVDATRIGRLGDPAIIEIRGTPLFPSGLPISNFRLGRHRVLFRGFWEADIDIRLFYERQGMGNPAPLQTAVDPPGGVQPGKPANWYYYWAIDRSSFDGPVCQYSSTAGDPAFAFYHPESGTGTFASFRDASREIFVRENLVAAAFAISPAIASSFSYSFPENPATANPLFINIAWQYDSIPDRVNIFYAHEVTHRIMDVAVEDLGLSDDDLDAVPNSFEAAIAGMRFLTPPPVTGVSPDADSFGTQFTQSANSIASRDEEFYAWIGAGFSSYGTATVGPISLPSSSYQGETPVQSNEAGDWSVDGQNWNLSQ